jgi:hypothetical protein
VGACAAGGRIENDDGVFHGSEPGRGFSLFFKLGGRNLPA